MKDSPHNETTPRRYPKPAIIASAANVLAILGAVIMASDPFLASLTLALHMLVITEGVLLAMGKGWHRENRQPSRGSLLACVGVASLVILFSLPGSREFLIWSLADRYLRVGITRSGWAGPLNVCQFGDGAATEALPAAIALPNMTEDAGVKPTNVAIAQFRIAVNRTAVIEDVAVVVAGYEPLPPPGPCLPPLGEELVPFEYVAALQPLSQGESASFGSSLAGSTRSAPTLLTLHRDDVTWVRVILQSSVPGVFRIKCLSLRLEYRGRTIRRRIAIPTEIAFVGAHDGL